VNTGRQLLPSVAHQRIMNGLCQDVSHCMVYSFLLKQIVHCPCNLGHWLPEQYGCQARGNGFILRREYFADDVEAPCEEAWQTDVWHREEQALLEVYGDEAYMAGIELSSDGTAVNFKGTSLHPMYANLRNRPTKVRTSPLKIVCLINREA